jgi:hypothetical protein
MIRAARLILLVSAVGGLAGGITAAVLAATSDSAATGVFLGVAALSALVAALYFLYFRRRLAEGQHRSRWSREAERRGPLHFPAALRTAGLSRSVLVCIHVGLVPTVYQTERTSLHSRHTKAC